MRVFPDLVNLYTESMLMIWGFIICEHNLTNIRYADGTVLMTDTEGKLKVSLKRLVKKLAGKKNYLANASRQKITKMRVTNWKCQRQPSTEV